MVMATGACGTDVWWSMAEFLLKEKIKGIFNVIDYRLFTGQAWGDSYHIKTGITLLQSLRLEVFRRYPTQPLLLTPINRLQR